MPRPCSTVWRPSSVSSAPLRLRTRSWAPRVVLELLEPPGQGGLADADAVRGLGDGAGIGDRQEGSKQDQIHDCNSCMVKAQTMRFTQA